MLVVSPTLEAARFDAPADDPAWSTYWVGAPPVAGGAQLRKTELPLTLALSPLGGPGGATTSAAPMRPNGHCLVFPVAPHAGLEVVEKIEPVDAELTRHDQERTTDSADCAWMRAAGTRMTAAATMIDAETTHVAIVARRFVLRLMKPNTPYTRFAMQPPS
jgi:hypothetical protein